MSLDPLICLLRLYLTHLQQHQVLLHQGAPVCVKRAKEAFLATKRAAIFNLCPRGLRNMVPNHQDRFKENLDAWLFDIPDQATVPGCHGVAACLLHQVPIMQQQFDNV